MVKLLTAIIFLFYANSIIANADPIHCDPDGKYPVPKNLNKQMLFFIQRSLNSNTVIYDVNLTEQGFIDTDEPISVYWRRYNSNGAIKNLKWFETSFAYGIESENEGNGEFSVYFSSYKKRKARLYVNKSNKPVLEISMLGYKARPYCAYVQLKDNAAIYPQVLYVDLYGRELKTGKILYEKLENIEPPDRYSHERK